MLGEAEKFAAFRRAHAALAASGTVSLELGLAGVPTVIAYRADPLARLDQADPSQAPSIVLTNLILGENAVPEFLDSDAGAPDVLARETLALSADAPARDAQLAALHRLADVMALPAAQPERQGGRDRARRRVARLGPAQGAAEVELRGAAGLRRQCVCVSFSSCSIVAAGWPVSSLESSPISRSFSVT